MTQYIEYQIKLTGENKEFWSHRLYNEAIFCQILNLIYIFVSKGKIKTLFLLYSLLLCNEEFLFFMVLLKSPSDLLLEAESGIMKK